MMRPTVAALLGGLLAITTALAQASQSMAITNVTVIDGRGSDWLPNPAGFVWSQSPSAVRRS
jgi:hypothetical protein